MNTLKEIYDTLKEDGTEVYFPNQHRGECIRKYNVIKMGGAEDLLNVSSDRPIFIIMCYVPCDRYTQLVDFVYQTKQKLKKMYPKIVYDGMETPSYYDEVVKGHRVSFQYAGIRKICNR